MTEYDEHYEQSAPATRPKASDIKKRQSRDLPMALPQDYARCRNGSCEHRETCLRSTDVGYDAALWFKPFPGGDDCHGRIKPGADHD